MAKHKSRKNTPELSLIGDVDDWEEETVKSLLEVPEEGECIFYIDSAGGSIYSALAVTTLIRLRRIRVTAMVLGECSSAALLVFAACQRRLVGPYCTLMFHPMRWQSDKHVEADAARQWSKHFDQLEKDLDEFQAQLFGNMHDQIREWTRQGRYLTGREAAAAGLAELLEI